MSDCKTAQELIARRSLASLDASDESALSTHLAACPACQQRAERLARVLQGLGELGRAEVRPRPEARARFLAAVAAARRPAARRSSRILGSRRRFLSARRWRRPAFGPAVQALVAAGLLLAVGLWIAHLRKGPEERPVSPDRGQWVEPRVAGRAPELPYVELASGAVVLQRAGQSVGLAEGSALTPGDRLITGARARALIRYADRSFAEMNRNTAVVIGDGGGGKQLSLDRGELFIKAAKQPAGCPMTLNPGRADQVLVVGTVFELARRDARTTVRMIEGRVAFGPEARSVVVNAGQASSVEPGTVPVAPEPCEISTIAAWRHGDAAATTPAEGTGPDETAAGPREDPAPAASSGPAAGAPGKVVVTVPGTGPTTPAPVAGGPDVPAGPKPPDSAPGAPDKDKDKDKDNGKDKDKDKDKDAKDGDDGKDIKKPPDDKGRPPAKPTPPGKIGGPGSGGKPGKGGK